MLCLTVPTDPAWIEHAARDVGAILVDHAHCEMKAASNALSLAARYPADSATVRALTDLAREEIDHFQRALGFLERRGLRLGPPAVDVYAASLRRAVSSLPRDPRIPPLVDRLLVGALIEARSCERFRLLEGALAESDLELRAFYEELFVAEARHYRTFRDLAVAVAGGDEAAVLARLDAVARCEGDIVNGLAADVAGSRATVHG